MTKKAFTLAEVLITLGIIGVVAAMTLPVLIKSYEEHVTVNKVKKFYSIMSQAYLQSISDNGYANEWTVANGYTEETANQLAQYIKPYLKIAKDCGVNSGCLNYSDGVKLLKNRAHYNYDVDTRFYKIVLFDGSHLWFRGAEGQYCKTRDSSVENVCGAFYYDINGKKEPNTLGIDIFEFLLTPNGIQANSNNDCNKRDNGWGCSSYILQNNNMKYLH